MEFGFKKEPIIENMLKRIFIYLREMYPLSSWFVTFSLGFMVLTVAWRLGGSPYHSFQWHTLLGCVALCFFSLILRVKDEFKDFEDDKINYPNRPVPSGRVLKKDLLVLGWFCVFVTLAVSVWSEEVLYMAMGSLIYSFLMLKWFFQEERMKASLPLALITHHPIVVLHFMYLLTVNQTTNYPIYEWQILTILPLVLMMTNWELCRKIRMPKEENTYTTYSKIWGPRPASFAALILQLIVLTTGSYLIHAMGCSLIWNVVYALGFVGLMFPVFNYWRTIRTKKPLKFWAENQILWTVLSLITAGWWG